jgi:predicted nucleic acid-binding protein
VPDARDRGLLDTSVVVDLVSIARDALPVRLAISTLTLAELAAGPPATDDPVVRSERQDHLQRVESTFDVLPFDARAARAYARVFAATARSGRKARGPRLVDLLIASSAIAEGLPLYTRNPDDVSGLEDLLDVRAV